MGCGSSIADKAIGLDGHDHVKQYVIQKNKQTFAENYVKEIYKNTSGNIKRLKQKKIYEIDQAAGDAKKHLTSIKHQIEKRQPGSIQKAQNLHKKSADEVLGLNETLSRLENQKSIVNSRYEEQEKQILRDIREEYEKIYDAINPSTAKLLHINGLPEADRLKAFKWGDQFAEKEIALHNKQLKEEMDKKLDFSHYERRFDSIVPTKNLQDIVDDGRERASKTSVKGSKCVTC